MTTLKNYEMLNEMCLQAKTEDDAKKIIDALENEIELRIDAQNRIWTSADIYIADVVDMKLTGKQYIEKCRCGNPEKIMYDGHIYTASDLSCMDSEDYEEIMEFGIVVQ